MNIPDALRSLDDMAEQLAHEHWVDVKQRLAALPIAQRRLVNLEVIQLSEALRRSPNPADQVAADLLLHGILHMMNEVKKYSPNP